MNVSNVAELIRILDAYKIVIYGVGYVAKRFYNTLKEYGLDVNVVSFVTTTGSKLCFNGLPIIAIDQLEFDDNLLFCVAVHDCNKDDIILGLLKKGFERYILIYPFLYELMLGTPICINARIPLSKIWNAVRGDYSLAIRYLAIDNYYGNNINGYEIYKRFLSLNNTEKTSEMRLEHFIQLIKSWEKNGYDMKKCSSILENFKIFDGTHRIALAIYFKQEFVMCDIYPLTKNISEIHNQEAILKKKFIIEAGIEPEIINLLDEINKRIEAQYK